MKKRVIILVGIVLSGFFTAFAETDTLFTQHVILEYFGGGTCVAAQDLDGDTDIDFVATGCDSNYVGWFENNGNQQFTLHYISQNVIGARVIDVSDLDSDSDFDVIVTAFAGNKITWFENDGFGSFTEHQVVENWPFASFVFARDHVTETDFDMDGDGDHDLIATACDNHQISWFENDGNQVFTEHVLKQGWNKANYATGTDLDLDGDMDVVGTAKAGQIIWFNNDGNENFTEVVLNTGWGAPNSIIAADIDGDGDIDLAGTSCGNGDAVAWFENDGNENFTQHILRDQYAGARSINLGDIDQDGDVDIVAEAWQGAIASWFKNNGDKTFTEQVFSTAAFDMIKLFVVDLDQDGDEDILGACFGGNQLRWWENDLYHPGFSGDPTSGQAPVSVQFTDHSVFAEPVTYWAWDFNFDGIIDSYDQNPEWTFITPGEYTVYLEVHTASDTSSLILEDYISVFDGESGLRFDGGNSMVICPASPSLNLTAAYTVEAWINPDSYGESASSGFGRIVDKEKISIFLIKATNPYQDSSLVIQMKHADGSTSITNTPENSILLNEWQHIAVVYNGTDALNVYVNGVAQQLENIMPIAGAIQDNSTIDLRLGSSSSFSYGNFDGVIDEVRIWNIVRSESQIRDHMNHYLGGEPDGLQGYWKMNEGVGQVIVDFSGNSNTGDLHEVKWTQGIHLDPPVSIQDPGDGITRHNYLSIIPNPVLAGCRISYTLSETSKIRLSVHNLLGSEIVVLADRLHPYGEYTINWHGTDESGQRLPEGIYFIMLDYKDFHEIQKVMIAD